MNRKKTGTRPDRNRWQPDLWLRFIGPEDFTGCGLVGTSPNWSLQSLQLPSDNASINNDDDHSDTRWADCSNHSLNTSNRANTNDHDHIQHCRVNIASTTTMTILTPAGPTAATTASTPATAPTPMTTTTSNITLTTTITAALTTRRQPQARPRRRPIYSHKDDTLTTATPRQLQHQQSTTTTTTHRLQHQHDDSCQPQHHHINNHNDSRNNNASTTMVHDDDTQQLQVCNFGRNIDTSTTTGTTTMTTTTTSR
ncbi:hypothetical protein EDB83DRAFT_2317169 [Lactarius deliciosus]|nr:hypothetical protein EDB83DRAFT_2317169 [Lactarius deliciosus]